MAFTEFYCDASAGANINAGDKTANGVVTSTNGDWGNAAANRFTAAAGTPFSGVSVGDFASVYLDGATVAVYIGRVTAVNGGGASLDISSTAKSGTAPSTGATGRSCTTGGAWKGPNAASGFPFGFIAAAMTNTSGNAPRVNFKDNATYSITAGATHNVAGPVQFEGYTSTAGDGGRAVLDGGSPAVSFTPLVASAADFAIVNFKIANGSASGSSGSASGLQCSARNFLVRNVVSTGNHIAGFYFSGGALGLLIESETYGNNFANSASGGGVRIGASGIVIKRCALHNELGANGSGINATYSSFSVEDTIIESNAGKGMIVGDQVSVTISQCDFYNNTSDGLLLNGASVAANVCVENSNFIDNGGYGINGSGAAGRLGMVTNCGFGSGTAANTSGTTTGLKGMVESGSVTYGSNLLPWVDAPNGDFRINLAAAKGAGRGTFTQTASSYAGAVGYPDIGSNQHQDAGGSGGGGPLIGTGRLVRN
jgi:hypothetical protein